VSWKRAPVPLSGPLEALAARLEPLTTLARVQRVWPRAAGMYAARAVPTGERGGVVTVRCEDSTWAEDLQLQAAKVVERLNEELGQPLVTGLKVRGPAGRRRRR